MSSNKNAVEVINLRKVYGKFEAVKDISFTVKPGEIFGILGINGAGKTTTLKMLSGVLKSTSGKILINGHDIETDSIAAKQTTGYIPDRPYLYTKLTGREFLNFVGDLYNVENNLLAKRIDTLLEEYRLTQWQNELIESYSHGMRQRLATCAGLLHKPSVLIVDEPMVGLDPHGAKFLKEAFKKYSKEEGMAVLLSTHSLNVAEEVADRLIIIDHGTVIAYGTLDEIKESSGKTSKDLEDLFLQLTAESNASYFA
jgi:ABC-2 type transport system ATP-binding protein